MASRPQQPRRLGSPSQKKKKWSMHSITIFLVLFPIALSLVVVIRAFNITSTATTTTTSPENMSPIETPVSIKEQAQQKQEPAKQEPAKQEPEPATSTSKTTIGYAISLIKCGDFQSSTAGLIDAALVLRHSVHLTSSRNPASGSEFDYKMYAIVHRQAAECSEVLEHVGFEVLIMDPPILPSEIQGAYLKAKIHREWCCGYDEFVKLYAYTHIPHPIVVHVDIDFIFLKPMDELFRAMVYDKDTPEGKAAREMIQMERPKEHTLPDQIDAFFTKDWPQVIPGRKAGYQAGFIVLRPSKATFDEIIEVVRIGNYTEGYGRDNGWGGLGYGSFVGAMAMQGLIAYYYDVVNPKGFVEVNQCRYNWMGMDTRFNAPPNFQKRFGRTGDCRNNYKDCEDCTKTDISEIKNVHFTQCRKPWNCIGEGSKARKADGLIDANAGSVEKCLELVRKWHEVRTDFEDKFYALTNDERILQGRKGNYMPEVFMGHCSALRQAGYNPINATTESFKQLAKLYV